MRFFLLDRIAWDWYLPQCCSIVLDVWSAAWGNYSTGLIRLYLMNIEGSHIQSQDQWINSLLSCSTHDRFGSWLTKNTCRSGLPSVSEDSARNGTGRAIMLSSLSCRWSSDINIRILPCPRGLYISFLYKWKIEPIRNTFSHGLITFETAWEENGWDDGICDH